MMLYLTFVFFNLLMTKLVCKINLQICTKRGPLGACLKTERRTESNDNDIAKKYFKEPSELGKQREAAMRVESDEGNSLIQKLKQQSVENADKNKLLVDRKTFENNQVRKLFRFYSLNFLSNIFVVI